MIDLYITRKQPETPESRLRHRRAIRRIEGDTEMKKILTVLALPATVVLTAAACQEEASVQTSTDTTAVTTTESGVATETTATTTTSEAVPSSTDTASTIATSTETSTSA